MKSPISEQQFKKVKRMRNLVKLVFGLRDFFRTPKSKSLRKEIFIDTEFGKVRALGYGFENTEKAPVYFDLHAGGFVLGIAEMDDALAVELHKQIGCKIISIDYAKAPEFPYPAAVNQVYAVVKHVYENAEKYGIDTNKMAIGGQSAGGNLSTVACMKAKKEGKFQFVCQMLVYPPLDLTTRPLDKPQTNGGDSSDMGLIYEASYRDPAQAKDPYISPVYATKEELEGLPPALFILAGKDSLYDQGLKYHGRLQDARVETECHDFPNAAHGFTYRPSRDTTDAVRKMATFLRRYFN
jgi:acetyl esterase